MSSEVMTHPSPADVQKDPPVQAWHVSTEVGWLVHGICRRGLGVVLSMFCHPPIKRLGAVPAVNHLEIRRRPE